MWNMFQGAISGPIQFLATGSSLKIIKNAFCSQDFLISVFIVCGGETNPRPFSEKSKLGISMYKYFKVLHSLFSLYAKVKAIKVC